jgi:hypothetical protein
MKYHSHEGTINKEVVSETGSVTTPLPEQFTEGGIGFQEGFVPANPPLTDPFGPIILQIPPLGDFEYALQYYPSQLPLRPYEEVLAMESGTSNPTEGFTTPIEHLD